MLLKTDVNGSDARHHGSFFFETPAVSELSSKSDSCYRSRLYTDYAHVTDVYLERETIVRIDWPARSP